MTRGQRVWIWRYAAEERRRMAASRMNYAREAGWCVLLVLLRVIGR